MRAWGGPESRIPEKLILLQGAKMGGQIIVHQIHELAFA